jgi:hypothetical protein
MPFGSSAVTREASCGCDWIFVAIGEGGGVVVVPDGVVVSCSVPVVVACERSLVPFFVLVGVFALAVVFVLVVVFGACGAPLLVVV